MNSIHSILLVDDEPVVADGLQRTLRNFGFEVQLADNAGTARQMVENSKFDLILVDFDLGPKNDPKLSVSGTGLVFELRAAKVGLPILMYTVLEGEWYELASLHAGGTNGTRGSDGAPHIVLASAGSSSTETIRFWPTTRSR